MITLSVNGEPRKLDAPEDTTSSSALRDILGMTRTKFGCGLGLCGARPIRGVLARHFDLISWLPYVGGAPAPARLEHKARTEAPGPRMRSPCVRPLTLNPT